MIPPVLVAEVRRLLAQPGLSQRKVAQITGVSRASVGAIAAGRRPEYPDRCNPDDCEDEIPRGPAERCPTCGGMVYMPCQLCRVREIKSQEREKARMRAAAGTSWELSASH
jgi:hypothetical protein